MTKPKTQPASAAGAMISIAGTEMPGFEVSGIRAAVVYGDKSRQVLHIHHAVTFGKNKPPSAKEVEARALKLATSELRRRGVVIAEGVKALAVDPEALMAGVEYRVDKSGRALVPVGPQIPRAARAPGKSSAGAKRRARKT